MIKGYFQARPEFARGMAIYLIDDARNKCFTFEFTEHDWEEGMAAQESLIKGPLGDDLLRALGEALVMGGFLPQSAVDTELKATKYHLEDMRKLVFNPTQPKESE